MPWWALGLLVLGFIVVAQFIHTVELSRAIEQLRQTPEQQAREFSEQLKRELREGADANAERRREGRRQHRNELQQLINSADDLLRVAHDTFHRDPFEWSEWVTRHEWWVKEAAVWLELNADAPEVAKFQQPMPSPRVFYSNARAPLDAHVAELTWQRDGLKEILHDHFPSIA